MDIVNIYELEKKLESLAEEKGYRFHVNSWSAGEVHRIYYTMYYGRESCYCGFVDCNNNRYYVCDRRHKRGINLLTGEVERRQYRAIARVVFQEENDKEEEFVEFLRSKFWNFENIRIALQYYRKGLNLEKLPNTLTKEQLEQVIDCILENQNKLI